MIVAGGVVVDNAAVVVVVSAEPLKSFLFLLDLREMKRLAVNEMLDF